MKHVLPGGRSFASMEGWLVPPRPLARAREVPVP